MSAQTNINASPSPAMFSGSAIPAAPPAPTVTYIGFNSVTITDNTPGGSDYYNFYTTTSTADDSSYYLSWTTPSGGTQGTSIPANHWCYATAVKNGIEGPPSAHVQVP